MKIKLKQEFAAGSLGTQICEIKVEESTEDSKLSSSLVEEINNGFYIGKCVPKSCKFSMKLLDNEEKILQELSHPNIIKMAGSSETEDKKILILESFCYDLDYFIFQNTQPLPSFDQSELKQMIIDIATAFEYLHSKQISHNDVKPSNILCDSNNNLVVSDFGTAFKAGDKSEDELFELLSAMNKTYFAPELFSLLERNISTVNTCQSDIFSFGLVIFQLMFGGQLPFTCNHYVTFDKKFALLQSNPDHFFQQEAFSSYTAYWKEQYGFKYSLFVDFMQSVLHPDPKKRSTASYVLDHQWLESC